MLFSGVNFGIIFITSIFLNYLSFVECDINCHEDNEHWCVKTSVMFMDEINLYRVKHRAEKLQKYRESFCDPTAKQAKSLALSGKIMKDDPDYNPIHQYSNTFGHVEGIPYEKYGKNIAQGIVKRWYEEKNNYNGISYSPKIANFTRMIWNASNSITCAICSKDSNSHFIVCTHKHFQNVPGEFLPINNGDPTPEQFKKNVFFINDADPTTSTSTYKNLEKETRPTTERSTTTRTSTHNHHEEKTTIERSGSSTPYQKPTTHTPTSKTPIIYPSTHTNFEKETTTEQSGSSIPYHYKSPTACPLMKTLLAGILDMCATGVTPSRRVTAD